MKLNKRKGFTVVELVIVIAIIAVLAAVLIPTFAGLVRKANISKDTQLVRNLNTALATATEKPKTMYDALQIAADAGYLVDKINASATSNEVLYDSKNNVFCYYNATNPSEGSVEYIPESAQGSQINDPEEYYLLWKIYDKNDDIPEAADQKFSVYLADDAKVPALTVSVGFDAGTNTNVKEVTYNGTKGNSVVIRTYGGTLKVDAATDSVNHYGTAGSVIIENVAGNSYHEFGNVDILTVKNGRVVVENGNNIAVLQVEPAEGATPVVAVPQNVVLETVLLVKSGKSFTVAVGDKSFDVKADAKLDNIPAELEKALTKDVNGNLTFGVPGDYVAIIGTTPYESFTEALNAVTAGETIKLVKDITLTKMLTISNTKPFTLDLNGHQIAAKPATLKLDKDTNMTVQDTSAASSGMIYSDYTGIIVDNKSTLTVKSGTIKGDTNAVSNSGTVNIEGTANLKRNIGHSVLCKSGSTTNMFGGTVFDIGTTESTYNYTVNISGGTVENYVYATSVTGGTIKDLILIKVCEVKNATIIGSIKWFGKTVPTLTNVTLGEKFTIKNDGYELVNGVIKAKN